MAAEQVLRLFDAYWFETTIFTNKIPSPFHSTVDSVSQTHVVEVLPLDTKLLKIPTLQVRSFSDQNLGSTLSVFSDSTSPNSVLTQRKLLPILSGKEVGEFPLESAGDDREEEEIPTKKKQSHGHRRRLRKGKASRSLSDLEFKELKGFMDLGFLFSEEDKDSTLVSLIPGLQRLGREDAVVVADVQQNTDETVSCRPYLSEAWGVLDQRRIVNPLLNWKVPGPDKEIDMKDNLRLWAHTVASFLR